MESKKKESNLLNRCDFFLNTGLKDQIGIGNSIHPSQVVNLRMDKCTWYVLRERKEVRERQKGEGRREKGEGRREKGEGRREKKGEERREKRGRRREKGY
jgi:hypothetical protein